MIIYRLEFNVGIYLAPIVHVEVVLADITPMPHNPVFDMIFNFMSHIPIPYRNGQYLNLPV